MTGICTGLPNDGTNISYYAVKRLESLFRSAIKWFENCTLVVIDKEIAVCSGKYDKIKVGVFL